MKRTLFVILISAVHLINLLSQVVSYEKGQIVTKNNDTISALIELTPTYQSVVNYKANSDSKIQSIKIKEINFLTTPYNLFRNIAVKNKEYLFRVVVTNKVSLFEYSKKSSSSRPYYGTPMIYTPTIIIFAVKANGKMVIIKNKKDLLQISVLLDKCPDAKALVDDKRFKFENLKSVIDKLNNCN
jgi:uncharacterized membrane protein